MDGVELHITAIAYAVEVAVNALEHGVVLIHLDGAQLLTVTEGRGVNAGSGGGHLNGLYARAGKAFIRDGDNALHALDGLQVGAVLE